MFSRAVSRSLSKMAKETRQLVKSRLDEGVFVITINNPRRNNCVGHPTAKALVEAFERFEADESAKVAVLHGEGSNFCCGYDLKEVSEGGFEHADADFLSKYRYMGPTAMQLSKPLIAAVEGYAVAGGLEMSLLADLRVAAQSAKFGVFCRRVGVPLLDGGTVRLPKVVGVGRALDLILTGREVSATEGEKMGLVNRVVDDGKALEEAVKLAKLIAAHPNQCMLVDRASLYNSLSAPTLKEALDYEYREGISVLSESIQGAMKFMKRDRNSKL
ncbi:hypothetical protein PFISCL1PPCAC_23828 [Pristionchus fissidentatus]|uniref:Ech-3 n=1 Tax=Pristionchus fissidentatus TaxID=1538716 RepID=A0AAV5WKL9_9BILA|nr:hypothetical protein PFISCL1PPCAC_23828 [Pristionchus fissidentatus]